MSPTTAQEHQLQTLQRAKIAQCSAVLAESTSRMDVLARRTRTLRGAPCVRSVAARPANFVPPVMAPGTPPPPVSSVPSDPVSRVTIGRSVMVPGRRMESASSAALRRVRLGSTDRRVTACFHLRTACARHAPRQHAAEVMCGRCATAPTPGTPSAFLATQSAHKDTTPRFSVLPEDFGVKRLSPSVPLGSTCRVRGPWQTPSCASLARFVRRASTAFSSAMA
mmetsp:Transcript_34568/g.84084  ORF Transcript_34568/g.84084 Transcript_34568/m.84084 type:complete len:223 (+) Transcript_34568:1242-1910(+)